MKKLLSILGILTLTSTPLVNATLYHQKMKTNLSSFQSRNSGINGGYNPAYPSFTVSSSMKEISAYRLDENYWTQVNAIQSFNWKQYAPDWDSFLANYSQLRFNVFAETDGSGLSVDTLGSKLWNTSKITTSTNGADGNIHRDNYDKFWANARSYISEEGGWTSVHAGYYVWRSGDEIKINIACAVGIENGWAWDEGYSNIEFKSIEFISNEKFNNNQKQFTQSISKVYTFTSNTSGWLDSTQTKDIVSGEETISNKETIEKEFKSRILDSNFADFRNEWSEYVDFSNPIITIPNSKKSGQVSIKLNSKSANPPDFVKNFTKEFSCEVNLSFNNSEIINNIKSVFGKVYELITNTSLDPANDTIKDTTSGAEPIGAWNKTNLQRVNEEVQKRYDSLFTSHSDWKKLIKMNPPVFSSTKDKVTIKFADDGDSLISDGQWVEMVEMPIKTLPTPIARQRSFLSRVSVAPSKIVDPKNPLGPLILDQPEFIMEQNTFTFVYHNYLDISFETSTGANETFTVDGKEVEAFNNVFKTRLVDNRISDKDREKAVKHVILITGFEKDDQGVPKPKSVTFNIQINAKIYSSDFQWLGWEPLNDPSHPENYEQYLLTQQEIDGKPNPKYDPTINPETGTRQQLIWVSKEKDYLDKLPFPQDPLDEMGNIVPDFSTVLEKGYFAQAVVVNSGIKNINFAGDYDDVIDKVERVKIEPTTGEEIGTRQEVDLVAETQFSEAGMWEYLITIKDQPNIDPEHPINPADVDTYPPSTVKALGGSVIHKFLYISKEAEAYANFLDVPEIRENPKIKEFEDSVSLAASHLKWYIINTLGLSPEYYKNLSFESLFAYWKQYVSEMKTQQANPPVEPVDYKSLTKLEVSTRKTNLTSAYEIFDFIKKYVIGQVNLLSDQASYGLDYEIIDIKTGKAVNDTNAEELLDYLVLPKDQDDSTPKKTTYFKVKATRTSLKLKGEKQFTFLNIPNFDPFYLLNLEKQKLKQEKYNFSDQTDFGGHENKIAWYKEEWVKNLINKTLVAKLHPHWTGNDKSLIYNYDYSLFVLDDAGTKFGLETSEALDIIVKFLEKPSDEIKHTIKVSIEAGDDSIKLEGNVIKEYVNDPKAEIPPVEPPDPPVDPIDLADIFKDQDLGEISPTTGDKLTNQDIWKVLLKKNEISEDALNYDDFSLFVVQNSTGEGIKKYTLTIRPSNSAIGARKYKGSVKNTFTSKYDYEPPIDPTKIDIDTIFKVENIGIVEDSNNNSILDLADITKVLYQKNGISFEQYPSTFFTFKFSKFETEDSIIKYELIIGVSSLGKQNFTGEAKTLFSTELKDDQDHENKQKPVFNKKNLWWIIPLCLIGIGLIFVLIRMIMQKRSTKKGMERSKNSKAQQKPTSPNKNNVAKKNKKKSTKENEGK